MADIFDNWCEATEEIAGRKTLWRITEAPAARATILPELGSRVLSHYIADNEIAVFLEELELPEVGELIRSHFPTGGTGRSGDLGEILATELIEEWCDYRVPIRKLRHKDHREQAMRGEDVIAIRHNSDGQLELLKAEAKSAQNLATDTVAEARASLEAYDGRPSPHAIMFTARRLMESEHAADKALGKKLLAEALRREVPKTRIAHLLFALTGNRAGSMIDDDFNRADGSRDQITAHLRITDHADFVRAAFDEAITHADD